MTYVCIADTAYDAAAHIGRIGNSLSHLMLALSASLQQTAVCLLYQPQ